MAAVESNSSSTTASSGSVATDGSRTPETMLLYETRRQRASRERLKVLASSSAVRLGSPAHRVAGRRLDPFDCDAARRPRGECFETRDDFVVLGRMRPLRSDDAIGVPRKQESPQ